MASQKGLGKGLGALLGDFDEGSQEENGLKKLPLHKIEPNPDQPRRDFSLNRARPDVLRVPPLIRQGLWPCHLPRRGRLPTGGGRFISVRPGPVGVPSTANPAAAFGSLA